MNHHKAFYSFLHAFFFIYRAFTKYSLYARPEDTKYLVFVSSEELQCWFIHSFCHKKIFIEHLLTERHCRKPRNIATYKEKERVLGKGYTF